MVEPSGRETEESGYSDDEKRTQEWRHLGVWPFTKIFFDQLTPRVGHKDEKVPSIAKVKDE